MILTSYNVIPSGRVWRDSDRSLAERDVFRQGASCKAAELVGRVCVIEPPRQRTKVQLTIGRSQNQGASLCFQII